MDQELKDRKKILDLVEEYYTKYHQQSDDYKDGDRVSYGGRKYDAEEMVNLVDASLDFWLTSGRYCAKFEKEFGKMLNVPYVSTVNSGSSANLIAFMALTDSTLGNRRIKKGDEVITVACGFPTTVSPIIQYGAIPVFVDVCLPNYNINIHELEAAVTEKTKAVMIAHTLGNPFDIKAVKAICDKYNLWLIEDNCDALGSKYTLDDKVGYTGTFGDIGTSSFYPPHHLTMGEGGAVYTKDPNLHKIIRSLRDWGRDCVCSSGHDNMCGHRFDKQYGELPFGYDHKYVYSRFGYNLKITEMQAAIGCAQLNKLNTFTSNRKFNFDYLYKNLVCLKDYIILPEPTENADPNWFGFLITVKSPYSRDDLVQFLEKHNVQTRALFAGNIIKHPCFDEIRGTSAYRVASDLQVTNRILQDTLWIGVYPGMTKGMLDYMIKMLKSYFDSIKS